MARRFPCLGMILLLTLLGAPACNSDSKPPSKAAAVNDPEGNAKPKPGGIRGG
jgi:hypothetical protein